MSSTERPIQHKATIVWRNAHITAMRWSQNGLLALDGCRALVLHHSCESAWINSCGDADQILHADWSDQFGQYLAIAKHAGIEVFEFFDEKKVGVFPRGIRPPSIVRWSPHGRYLAVAARAIFIYDTANEAEVMRTKSHPGAVLGMAWAHDESKIVTVDGMGHLRIHDLWSGTTIELQSSRTTISGAVAWSPCGKFLAVPHGPGGHGVATEVLILDSKTYRRIGALQHSSVQFVQFSSGSGLVVTKGTHHGVRVWRTSDWRQVAHINDPDSRYVWIEAAFDPYDSMLATHGEDGGSLRIWKYTSQLSESESVIDCVSDPEIQPFDVSEVVSLNASTNRRRILEWRSLLRSVEKTSGSNEKGEALQMFCEVLFASVPNFSIQSKVRTSDEEIDIVVFHTEDSGIFSKEGPIVLVECKNWSGRCGKDEVVLFRDKMINRGGRCTLGFLVSWNGFANTVEIAQLRKSLQSTVVVCISGDHVKEAVELGDFGKVLHREFKNSLLL